MTNRETIILTLKALAFTAVVVVDIILLACF